MSKDEIYPEAIGANATLLCQDYARLVTSGFWTKESPLHFATPLLLFQLSLVSVTAMLIDYCIKPLGQSTMVSQIVGGIIFGPSLLGHHALIGEALFPPRGKVIFDTFATFGIIFYIFTIGVKMDAKMIIHPGCKAIILSVSMMSSTLVLSVSLAMVLKNYTTVDDAFAKPLTVIAASQCLTSFSNVITVLHDLKMVQTDVGRMAISTSTICDVIGFSLVAVATSFQKIDSRPLMSVFAFSTVCLFIAVSAFLIRPLILRILSRLPEGKSLGETHIFGVFVAVLLAGLVSEIIGQHFVFGPAVLGLVMPEGPPLGAALSAKLDVPVGKMLYPSFLTSSGLKTDVFKVHFLTFWMVTLIVFTAALVKIGTVMLSARFLDITIKESVVLGLIFNVKGFFDLVLFNLLMDAKVMRNEAFTVSVLSVVAITAITTPLIKAIYDPMRVDVPMRRRTIQHLKRDSELRILVCIHNQEDVPAMVHLLEASNATEDSPITVIAVLLVELVGRAAPMLVAHQSHRLLEPSTSRSGRIINALRQYELDNETCVTIQSFSSISQFETMHEDISRVALDQNVTIIILPFHKHWAIDGTVETENRAIQNMNSAVADKSPCSVAILVDRKIVSSSISILNSRSTYHVAMLYIGGPDDAEALSYGARMARHPNVHLTIIRFLLFGCDNARERKYDTNLIDEVRHDNMGNDHFTYQEEIVRDGVGLATSIKGLGHSYDLIIVGMNHQDSPIFVGLGAWIECPELGVVGDMLAENDPKNTASILVVQQQRIKGKLITRDRKPVVIDEDPFLTS